jgi:catechol 2,3-dioxygenase-like lactoylglutathione lyase family enzyme
VSGNPDLLRGARVYQLGLLVPDLREALAGYSRFLGLGPWVRYVYGPDTVRDFTYRGRPVGYSIEIALTGRSPQVELIEVRGRPSLYHEWIDTRGYGLHHVGVEVGSLAAAVEEMTAAGYQVLQSGHGYGLDGDGGFAYFDTLDELGVIVEAIEIPERRRPPDAVWPEEPGPTRAGSPS